MLQFDAFTFYILQVVYSNYKLRPRQLDMLDNALESIEYICGTNIRDVSHSPDHIFQKVNLCSARLYSVDN